MERQLTTQQIENIQIDYGMVYINYGEVDQRRLGPTRGGGTFTVTKTLRDIEFDGSKGKTKGLQVIDDINAMISLENLDISMTNLALNLPYATLTGDGSVTPYKLTVDSAGIGVLPDSAYLTNVTMFCKLVSGEYKKITLFNAMSENDFTLSATPKAEGTVTMEIMAHWNPTDDTADLFTIEDVTTI